MDYPRYVYKGGVLSSNPADARLVNDEVEAEKALADGFKDFETVHESAFAAGTSSEAATEAAAFAEAETATTEAATEAAAEPVVTKGKGKK